MRHALIQSGLSARGMEVWAPWMLPMTERASPVGQNAVLHPNVPQHSLAIFTSPLLFPP